MNPSRTPSGPETRAPLEDTLSVVIPALDEADWLPELLEDLRALLPPEQVVVVDGGSTDGTPTLAAEAGARVLHSRPGRACQMNRGARATRSTWLLFLHADSRIPPPSRRALVEWLDAPEPSEAATFRYANRERRWYAGILEGGQRMRERLGGLAYGDQGLLVSRRRFEAVGGYPEVPIMEDVEIVRRLRRGPGLSRIDAPLPTSLRRYEHTGPLRGWARNALLMSLWLAGVPPRHLARFYGNGARTLPAPDARRTLVIFAKAPRPGTVKTRLARDIGDAEAAHLYRTLGRSVVDPLRTGPWRTVVRFAPADAHAEIAAWLGTEALTLRPQPEGDLGARMHHAFVEAFAAAPPPAGVCLVGTDAPELSRTLVHEAFERLEGGDDVVLGPAEDGGYYLIALAAPRASLFDSIPWSTDRVLPLTRERIRAAGLVASELRVLNDIDDLGDLKRAGL